MAAQNSVDSSWYRAKIENVIVDDYDDSKVEVDIFFVDFGDTEKKRVSEVYELPNEFLKLKFQAIACCLLDIKAK